MQPDLAAFEALSSLASAFRSAFIHVLANDAMRVTRSRTDVPVAQLSVWRNRSGMIRVEAQGLGRDKEFKISYTDLYSLPSSSLQAILKFLEDYLPLGREAYTFTAFLGKEGIALSQSNRCPGEFEGESFGLSKKDSAAIIAALAKALNR